MQAYKIYIMGIQENHLKGRRLIGIRSTGDKDTHELFYTEPLDNKHHGVEINMRKDLKAEYQSN